MLRKKSKELPKKEEPELKLSEEELENISFSNDEHDNEIVELENRINKQKEKLKSLNESPEIKQVEEELQEPQQIQEEPQDSVEEFSENDKYLIQKYNQENGIVEPQQYTQQVPIQNNPPEYQQAVENVLLDFDDRLVNIESVLFRLRNKVGRG